MTSWSAEQLPPQVPPEEVRETADRILGRPEYREPEPSLVERVLDAIGDFLSEAIATLTGGGPGSVVATAVVVGLLAVAAWFLVRALGARPSRVQHGPAALVQGTAPAADPAEWLAEAERLLAAGAHRRALRCRYQATVATLLRDGVVDDVPGRTPRELARELVAVAPVFADDVHRLTGEFERVWYGGDGVGAADYERFARTAERVEGLRASAPARRPVGASS